MMKRVRHTEVAIALFVLRLVIGSFAFVSPTPRAMIMAFVGNGI